MAKLPEWVTMTALVEKYNELSDKPIKGFSTVEAGYERVKKLMNAVKTKPKKMTKEEITAEAKARIAAVEKTPAKKGAKKTPAKLENPYRNGSNCSKVFDMLLEGTTIDAVMKSLKTTKKNTLTYFWWVKDKGFKVEKGGDDVYTVQDA